MAIMLFVQASVFLFYPEPVHAQVTTVGDVPREKDNIIEEIFKGLEAAALGALVQGASYFMRKVAYDTAVYIGSGGKGQGALAISSSFGDYIEGVALDSVAETIDQFGKGAGIGGLCEPPSLQLKASITISIDQLYATGPGEGPQPSCNWQQLTQNWENASAESITGVGSAEDFFRTMNVEESDFGISLGLMAQLGNIQAGKEKEAEIDSLVGEGFKPVTDLISGNVKTPAQVVQEETMAITSKQQTELSAEQIAGVYGSAAEQILPMAASVFLGTMVTTLLDNVMTNGIIPSDSGDSSVASGGASSVLNFYSEPVTSNKKAAQEAFNFFVTAIPVKQQNVFPIIAQFAACDKPGIHNCVIDSGLRDALTRKDEQPLTIREAMNLGLMKADWPLISPVRDVEHTDIKNCYQRGYCYSNIQKLRKVRVLPLGFEIAVLKSDPDQPWTLGQVVDGFNDCEPNGKPSVAHPYCHLIDPNWVLRVPEVRCETEVISNALVTENAPTRRSECVDLSTCLLENPDGTCQGNYGYCTKEKNVWRIPGQSCEPQNNTCTTYRNTASNGFVSYLERTVSKGNCTIDNVGCTSYSAEKDADGNWIPSGQETEQEYKNKLAGRSQALFFNQRVIDQSCPAGAEGCTAFVPAVENEDGGYSRGPDSDMVHLQKAPDYLGCYDTDPATFDIQWPKSISEIENLIPENNACGDFAQVCAPEEVGCEAFNPKAGGPVVPGIVGNNSCNEQCVGYDTFKQLSTDFAPERYPVQFIPSLAQEQMAAAGQSCSLAAVGCSEFTNIDAATAGGEALVYFSDIKHCERPTDDNIKTFYSWEGSANTGFTLQIHKLRPYTSEESAYIATVAGATVGQAFAEGSPAYADDSETGLALNYELCNQEGYNLYLNTGDATLPGSADPSCRALYDDDGNVYYRLLAETITVSNECTPLRKTESELYVDNTIDAQGLCEQKQGFWDGNSCQRCYGGGFYEGGSCVYWAIDAPGESVSCGAAANNCREYVGNAGNNVALTVSEDFEPGEDLTIAWQGTDGNVSIAAEAIQVGLHSLRIDATRAQRPIDAIDLFPGALFELSFWARGTSQKVSVWFEQDGQQVGDAFTVDPVTGAASAISVGTAWQQYQLGPVEFAGDASKEATLVIDRDVTAAGSLFVDNLELRRFTSDERLFLIKDSWKTPEGYEVPLACDSSPFDGLPGEALGCRAYTDSDDADVFATGFEALCRPEAVGCEALLDTHNTLDTQGYTIFNIRCTGESGSTCTLSVGENTASCAIPVGADYCYVDKMEIGLTDVQGIQSFGTEGISESMDQIVNSLQSDPSTIFIPADTPTNAPIFLTNNSETRCDPQYQGCTLVAEETPLVPGAVDPALYEFTEVYLVNNPDIYTGQQGILCQEENVACSEFVSDDTISYFKDPTKDGNALCSYKTNINVDGLRRDGWFFDNIGVCSGTLDQLCTTDSACAEGSTCDNIGSTACYDNYLLPDDSFGLYSNNNTQYAGLVGQCPATENGCTELVDPADTSGDNPDGTPYYVIFNSDLTDRIGECSDGVSLKEGCVIFDKTDEPKKVYSSAIAQEKSEQAQFGFVPLADVVDKANPANNDANIILKVNRDRQCSEWLACESVSKQVDPKTGEVLRLCDGFGICNEAGPDGQCTNWIGRDLDTQHVRLTEENYINRGTSWYDEEYVGYSLFNKYPIDTFKQVGLSKLANEDRTFLTHAMSPKYFEGEGTQFFASCEPTLNFPSKDGFVCANGGRCFSGQCLFPIDGSFSEKIGAIDASTDQSTLSNEIKLLQEQIRDNAALDIGQCKSYPEADSPFPLDVAINPTQRPDGPNVDAYRLEFPLKQKGYEKANVCQDGACECRYEKVVYGGAGVTDYFDVRGENQPNLGICIGGESQGNPCDPSAPAAGCGDHGTCEPITENSTRNGFFGFCLEEDLSRPGTCLTWLPIDTNATALDSFNNNPDAGYNPIVDAQESNADGKLYCLEGTGKTEVIYDANAWTGSDITSSIAQEPSLAAYYDVFAASAKLGRLPVYDNASDYSRKLYSATSLWANFELGRKNNTVYRIDSTPSWPYYAASKYGTGLIHQENSSIDEPNRYPTGINDNDTDLDIEKISFETQANMSRLYVAPLVLQHTASVFFKNAYIDFDSLRARRQKLKDENQLLNPSSSDNAFSTLGGYVLFDGVEPLGASYNNPKFVFGTTEFTLENDKFSTLFQLLLSEGFIDNDLSPGDTVTVSEGSSSAAFMGGSGNVQFTIGEITPYADAEAVKYNIVRFQLTDWFTNDPEQIACGDVFYGMAIVYGGIDKDVMETLAGHIAATKGGTSMTSFTENAGLQYLIMFIDDATNEPLVDCKYQQTDNIPNLGLIKWSGNIASEKSWIGCVPSSNVNQISGDGLCENQGGYSGSPDGFVYKKSDANRYGYYFFDTVSGPQAASDYYPQGPGLGYILELKNECVDYALVHQDQSVNNVAVPTDKAWTNRVWKNSFSEIVAGDTKNFFNNNGVTRPTWRVPFGSLNYLMDDFLDTTNSKFFDDMFADGVPYACTASLLPGLNTVAYTSVTPCSGYAQAENYNTNVRSAMGNHTSGEDSKLSVRRIFAAIFGRKQRTAQSEFTVNVTEGSFLEDVSGTIDPDGIVPQIYALNPATCTLSGEGIAGERCTAAEKGHFTINGKNGTMTNYDLDEVGNADEDKNFDGTPDAVIGIGGQLYATLQFFAFGDENRMPLRRVMVDWGDGSSITNEGKYGRLQNRKPICGNDVGRCAGTQLTCDPEDADIGANNYCLVPAPNNSTGFTRSVPGSCEPVDQSFGDADRACLDKLPFDFEHPYTCSDLTPNEYGGKQIKFAVSTLSESLKNRLKTTYKLKEDDVVCRFTPKVQVLDNWGFCNGECLGFEDGCYSSSNKDRCSPDNQNSGLDNYPWTEYQGELIVIPKKK